MTHWFKKETTWTTLDTSGKETQDICTRDQNSHVCRAGLLTDRFLGKFHTCHQGYQDIYWKDPEGQTTSLSRYNWGSFPDHCWDTQAPHTRVLLHAMLISLGIGCHSPCPAGLRTLSALLPTWLQRSFLARCWQLTCPPSVSQTCKLRLWDLGSLSPIDCSVCVCYISLRLLECE